MVRSHEQMKKVILDVPKDWNKRDDLRCYVAFLKKQKPDDVLKEIDLNKEVDFIKTGEGVLYMTTLLSGLVKSGYTKMIGKKIYREMTIRNYNTTRKIFERMEE